ncbi:MAG: hypothetical protein MJA27_00455 [Pseudanabaenales cyanobacterium]|nr:hypothetical protein [Pseudanabaenales cyanobacterium]
MTPIHEPMGSRHMSPKPLIAGALMFGLLWILFDFQGMKAWMNQSPVMATSDRCETIVQSDVKLSRAQLASLLTIPERDTKARVRQVIEAPYCKLPELKVRSGVLAEREAYPLAFDPKTQLVILYENDEYAGYRFSFE